MIFGTLLVTVIAMLAEILMFALIGLAALIVEMFGYAVFGTLLIPARKPSTAPARPRQPLTWRDALVIGAFAALALWRLWCDSLRSMW
jgi:undecaprenyl pyrophosphate phosphatase UppP